MSAQNTPSAEEVLAAIAAGFAADPEVARTRMFGSDGLKAAGKVFAIASRGKLVLKLPKSRVDELVAAGARRFEPGPGRVMKEWVALEPDARTDWKALAEQARRFVAG